MKNTIIGSLLCSKTTHHLKPLWPFCCIFLVYRWFWRVTFYFWKYLQLWQMLGLFFHSNSAGIGTAHLSWNLFVHPFVERCLLVPGVHLWERSYKYLIVFGNRDDGTRASGLLICFCTASCECIIPSYPWIRCNKTIDQLQQHTDTGLSYRKLRMWSAAGGTKSASPYYNTGSAGGRRDWAKY